MKKINEILHSLDDKEISPLLNEISSKTLSKDMSDRIKEKVLFDTSVTKQTSTKRAVSKRFRKNILALASCLMLTVAIGVGTIIYAHDVKEYNDALEFFAEHELSTDGLSRVEIKTVYRDIITETFKYDKTAEVIESKLNSSNIKGYEIILDAPTPEEMRDYWDEVNNGAYDRINTVINPGIRYHFSDYYGDDHVVDGCLFEKYEDDILKWSVDLPDHDMVCYTEASDGLLIYGNVGDLNDIVWVVKLNNDGEILWERQFGNMNDYEYIGAVLENADGSYSVLSHGDKSYLSFTKLSYEGQITVSKKYEVGDPNQIGNAVSIGEGYAVQLYQSIHSAENMRILLLDNDGDITESQSYSGKYHDYYITDMIEFNDTFYLSAYAIPKLSSESSDAGGRPDIAHILNYLHDNNIWQISSEDLTPLMRDNFTAVLLVCADGTNVPTTFYSVDGSLGGSLDISDSGKLLWNVESIIGSAYSPATSYASLIGFTDVYCYQFDGDGALKNIENTGEDGVFYR